jgi:putative transposase
MTTLMLTTWQRRRLERQLRETLDARVYRRTLAILEVAQGEPVASVAQRLRVTSRVVYLWVEAYCQGHDPTVLRDSDRSGRPSLLTQQDRGLLLELLHHSPQDYDYPATEWTVGLLQKHLIQTLARTVWLP